MTIGQYDYRIEHKSGHKIPHADALSRYPPKDPNTVLDLSKMNKDPSGTSGLKITSAGSLN